jgi:hypothetical protein
VFFRPSDRPSFSSSNDSQGCGGNAITAAGSKKDPNIHGGLPFSRGKRASDTTTGETSNIDLSMAYYEERKQKQNVTLR